MNTNTIELVDGYDRSKNPSKRMFRVIGLDEVISWSKPVSEPCNCTNGMITVTPIDEDHAKRIVEYFGVGAEVGISIDIPHGSCNGTMQRQRDITPSHVWFVSMDGRARQAKVNGKVRTWKRDARRVELPLKYGLYEYSTFTTADIEAGRLIAPLESEGK